MDVETLVSMVCHSIAAAVTRTNECSEESPLSQLLEHAVPRPEESMVYALQAHSEASVFGQAEKVSGSFAGC